MLKEYEQKIQGKRIMITGGLGFIGSNLAHRLIELNPARIVIVDSLVPGLGGDLKNVEDIKDKLEIPNLDLEKGGVDISESEKIKEILRGGIDYIFNLAGSVNHISGKNSPLGDLDINLRPHVALLQACREFTEETGGINKIKIIFTGTRDQYGKLKTHELPAKEEHNIKEMADPQGIHNNAAEFHHLWYRQFGIEATSLRLSNIYGPRHPAKNPGQGFTNWFIKQAMNGEEIQLWGGGESLRDFNYVEDAVDALLMVATSPKTDGQVYNLGAFIRKNGKYVEVADNIKTVGEIAQLITEIAQKGHCTIIPYPKDKKSIEVGHFYADSTKIYEEVGWEPKVPLSDGIRRTIEFYKGQQVDF